MSKKGMRKIVRSCLCFLMALLLAFQGTGSLFVQAKETVENSPRNVDMSRPEALTSKEAGIEEPEPENVEVEYVPETEIEEVDFVESSFKNYLTCFFILFVLTS